MTVSDDDLMLLFEYVHGRISGACYTKVFTDDEDSPAEVAVIKDGNICWSVTKLDLVFEYIVRQIKKESTNI